MNKKITRLMAAFALFVLVALSGKAWATDVTFSCTDYTGQGTQGTGSEYTMEKTDVSITNTKFYGNTSYAHFYANGTTTIAPEDGVTITQIVLTATGTNYNGYQSGGTVTSSVGSISNNGTIVTWTGSAAEAFTISNNKQIRWTSIVVTYSISGSVPTPTITLSDTGTGNIGNYAVNTEISRTFTVSQSDLTEGITLTATNGGTLTPSSIEQGAGTTEVTWNFTTPETPGQFTSTITATSGETSATCTYLGYAYTIHNVNIASMEHGTVTANPSSTFYWELVSLTVTPDDGYELEALTVVDAYNSPINITNNSFHMPDSDVTVSATFVEAAPTITVTDVLNYEFTGISGSGYQSWSDKTGQSGAVYAGQSNAGVTYIQLRSTSPSGIVSTTSGGKVKKVTVTWNSGTADARTLNVYGNNTAYTDASDLYGSNAGTLLGTLNKGEGDTELIISSNYTYVGLRSASGAMYLDEIDIDWETTGTPTCAAPTFNPAAGTYTETQTVSISCATEGATIYYTLDGNDPTTSSSVYSEALSISETTTVKAMAVLDGYNNSAVASATYTIIPPAVATPTFSPEAGIYTEAQTVTISCETDGATIQYKMTENGEWQVYAEALTINETTTIWAKATKEGMTDSEIATAVYTIEEALNTMQAIFDRATEVGNTATDVNIALQNWVVSGVSTNGKNVFVTDGTKGFVIFNSGANMGFAVGDILSGTVSCKVQLYNGFAELTQLNSSTEGLSVATGGTVTVAEIAMADLAGVNTSALVSYNGLTCSLSNNKYYLTDGTTTLQVYNALYAFTELEDGKTYNITGVYQQYNNTKEILPRSADDIEEVTVVEPSVTVTPATLNVDANEHEGNLAIAYENLNIAGTDNFDVNFYEADGTTSADYSEWLDAEVVYENESYSVYYTIQANAGEARTAYLKVYVLDEDAVELESDLVTINQAQYVVDYATLPFEWDSFGTTPNGITNEGVSIGTNGEYLKFDGSGDNIILKFNEIPGTLTFNVKGNPGNNGWEGTFKVQTSIDGVTYTDLQIYTELLTSEYQPESFATLGEDVRYIKWIYEEKVSGNVALKNIVLTKPDFTPSITVDPSLVEATAAGGNGTLSITLSNMTISDDDQLDIVYCYENGEQITNQEDIPNWLQCNISVENEAYVVSYSIGQNMDTEAHAAYFKVYGLDDDGVTEAYSDLVTVTQEAYVAPFEPTIYTRVTTIVPGEHYIIVSFKGDEAFAMGDQLNNYRQSVAISADGTNATVVNEDVFDFVIQSEGNNFTIYDSRNAGYLCAVSNNSNSIGFQTTNDDNGVWSISMEADGEATVAAQGEYTRNHLRYNTNNPRFSCYAETSSVDTKVYFYVKSDMAPATYTLNINGYANDDVKDGYYLIASPVYVNPATVEGMTTDDFDLYYYDDAEELEWRNYEETPFSLVPGKGYLYAKKATVENPTYSFDLTGVPYDGQGEFNLTAGWNLVGNPFGQTAYIEGEFYAMNEEGSEIMTNASTGAVAVMQGVFVLAGEEGEIITFTPQAPQKKAGLALNLISNRSNVIDRAIVRFGEGRQLPKFQLNPNNTKLFISQGNNDFAVVRSAAYGEMPVSFKAQSNGTYTISVNAENVEVNYLHLIDNMTGNDIDLLATPSYSFEAKTTDYASRFRLVFNVTGVEENTTSTEPFAFFNGSEWVISNMGTATLQMVDLTGRILSSESISGNATFSTANLNAGVYVMRLVNGENTKIQKIIIK